MKYLVLIGTEGEEDEPVLCTSEDERDSTVEKAENRGEFCVVYELSTPSYATTG